jgi:hypothetical protein
MMKRYFFSWMMLLPSILIAQVTISVQIPPAGLLQHDQLWNLVLMNNSSQAIDATISMTLQDMTTGYPVLSASTNNITLPRGVKMLAAKDVQPLQYTFSGPDLPGTYLPLGTFNACYTISKNEGDHSVPVATECVRVAIRPLSPPLLVMPADKSVINTPYPQFSWVSPAPMDMFTDLSYDISIAEIFEGQSANDAVFNNTPVYAKNYLKIPFETYPASMPSLQRGKRYAWQVVAKNGLNYSAQTEIWTFTLPVDSSYTETTAVSYIVLADNNAGVNTITGEKLYIKYYSFFKEHEVTLTVSDDTGKKLLEQKQRITYGDNFLEVKLNRNFTKGPVYKLELEGPQQSKPALLFSIKKTNTSN